jgi:hypothetical protein
MDIFRSILILVRAFFGNRFVPEAANVQLQIPSQLATMRNSCVDIDDGLFRGDSHLRLQKGPRSS